MRTEDGYIISKCLDGDSGAYGLLIDKYKAGVYALAYSKLKNFHDAQDIAQEVFIKVYENLHKLRRWESFAGWLYRITARECSSLMRSRSKRPDREFMEDNAKIYFGAPTVLRMANEFNTGIKAYFGPQSGASLTADDIQVYVCSDRGIDDNPKAAQIGEGGTFYGHLYATNGTLWIIKKAQATGSFVARDVIVGIGTTIARTGALTAPSMAYTGVMGDNSNLDSQLAQNYPNPFNPETWIPYRLGKDSDVIIKIHSASGQLVRTLELGHKPAGLYSSKSEAAHWDGANENGESVASGVYFYSIQAGKYASTRKLLVQK